MTAARPASATVAVAVLVAALVPVATGGAPVGRAPSGLTALQADAPRFVDPPYREHRGDVVRVPVAVPFGGTSTVTLRRNDSGYTANVTITDGSGDGRVTLLWNAYAAGGNAPDATFRAAAEDDAATVRSESAVVGRLPGGAYRLRVATGPNATPADRATVELAPAEPPTVTVLRARGRHFGNLTAPADVTALRRAGELASAPPTDVGDSRFRGLLLGELVVLRVRAPGLAGALAAADGPNATGRFGNLLGGELALRLVELSATVQAEEEPGEFRFGDFSGRRVVADPGNDTYYLVVDPSAPVDVDRPREEFVDEYDLEGYRVHLGVPPDAGLPDGVRTNATAAFQFVEPTATVDDLRRQPPDGDGPEVVVSGSAVLPVGEAVVVRLQDGESELFVERRVPVGLDGAFEAAFDVSAVSVGEYYEVAVGLDGSTLDRTTHRLLPWAVVRFDGGERSGQHVEAVRVDRVATTGGGFVTVRRDSRPGTVLGHSAYLPPGNHTDVRVPIDASLDGNVTLVAVARRDDGDRTFEPGADGYYSAGDPSDAATLVDVGGTATATATPTRTAPSTPTGPSDDGVPGFGPAAAVAALVAIVATLLARRRSGGGDR